MAAREYALKAAAERRLTENARAEADVKLLTLFVELMPLANARGQAVLSEGAATALLQALGTHDDLAALDEDGKPSAAIQTLLSEAVVVAPVGAAMQAAALSAIAELGARYPETLGAPASEAIDALSYIEREDSGPVEAWRRARALLGPPARQPP